VWVPDQQQEAMRDLTRIREDMKSMERRARQRLNGFLLRNKRIYTGQNKWTQAHFRWLKRSALKTQSSRSSFQEYVDAVKHFQDAWYRWKKR